VAVWIYNSLRKDSLQNDKEDSMFDSLDDQMKKDLNQQTTTRQRMVVWLAIAAASVIVFGGLILGVRMAG
jgi:hypothetical protein